MGKKELLKDELEKHFRLLEYSFYSGAQPLEEQEPEEAEAEPAADAPPPPVEPGMEDPMAGTEPPMGGGQDFGAEEPVGVGQMDTRDLETPETAGEPGMEPEMGAGLDQSPEEGEVEVDVSDIVQTAQETNKTVNLASTKIDQLMQSLGSLEAKVSGMDDIIHKINELEHEMEKRNPTPTEKLELRSLDSYPYNLKLTDFWKQKELHSNYQAMDKPMGEEIPEEEEFTLTDDDVTHDYNEGDVRSSFYPQSYENED